MASRKKLWPALAAAALMSACIAPAAIAQDSARPPTPRKSDNPPYLWNIFILIVVVGAVFGANMIPSKRGHQD